jgi:hypothetical protein
MKQRGVSRAYINKLVRTGKLKMTNGQIDPGAGDQAIEENRDRFNAQIDGGKPGSPVGGLARAKTINEVLRSKLVQLERERELLRRDDVLNSVGECAEAIMRELNQLPLRADGFASAFMQGKVPALRAALGKVVYEIQTRIYQAMREFEKQADDNAA